MPAARDRKRLYTAAERTALFLAADGCCTMCGDELQPGWHADHEVPWSKGGRTDIFNGQAACPSCNLKKGSNGVKLRKWQEDGLRKFLGIQNDFLAVATPGAGKTTFAILAAKSMIDRSEITNVFVIVPTAHLRGQWARAAAREGIQLDSEFVNRSQEKASDFDGIVATYQSVAANPLLWRKLACNPRRPSLVIFDEIHHAGEAEHLSWGTALSEAFSNAHRRLSLSGTPFRSDGKPIPFLNYGPDRRVVADINYDYGMALQDQEVVRPVAFPAMDGEARWRFASEHPVSQKLSEADASTIAAALKTALDPGGQWIPSVLRRAHEELTLMRQDKPDCGGLVVATDQASAHAYADILRHQTGEDVKIAVSDDPAASKVIDDFARSDTRWIVAVQMVSEGVDIPRLGVIVYATRIRTEMFFRQVVGRCVRKQGDEDEMCARVFIPSIAQLLTIAAGIERTVDAVLADEESKVRREMAEDESDPRMLPRTAEVLGSSAAAHAFTINSGEAFEEAELLHARRLGQQAGLPVGTEPSAIARLLRLSGGSAQPGAAPEPPVQQTRSERKKELRELIARKVGRLSRLTRKPHSHIHAELNRECQERKIDQATLATLEKRLLTLDKWLQSA
ncbi:DEAD/DEAH box helicase family protein [Streptomyces sp. t39]|uniref:DEAD/DEAH box helicase family protein n=1 Tax=Streptomyces sp. t39 TaxID=1828156 RepID=UPI0011CD985D|nr:DEAD/DEAH box helicase family protein [Streptomyces sp. t39]